MHALGDLAVKKDPWLSVNVQAVSVLRRVNAMLGAHVEQ